MGDVRKRCLVVVLGTQTLLLVTHSVLQFKWKRNETALITLQLQMKRKTRSPCYARNMSWVGNYWPVLQRHHCTAPAQQCPSHPIRALLCLPHINPRLRFHVQLPHVRAEQQKQLPWLPPPRRGVNHFKQHSLAQLGRTHDEWVIHEFTQVVIYSLDLSWNIARGKRGAFK